MLDWLRRDPRKPLSVEVAGRELPVVIRRLERARRLTMRLAPDGTEVRISMPPWAPTAEALAFAQSRADWLARQIAAMPVAAPMANGANLSYRGRQVLLVHAPKAPRRPVLIEDALHTGGPEGSLPARVARWLQGEAMAAMAEDLEYYCALAGQATRRLALSNARRRWGSCAPDGSIRINWRLIMAPDMVRRSVVAHEVAHLVHFDHSPAFHHCLRQLFEGSVHDANRWLKAHGRELYLPFG